MQPRYVSTPGISPRPDTEVKDRRPWHASPMSHSPPPSPRAPAHLPDRPPPSPCVVFCFCFLFASNHFQINGDKNGARHLIAADIDGDGDLDLVSAALSASEIDWYENGAINTTAATSDDEAVGSAPGGTPSPAAAATSSTAVDAPATSSSSASSPSPDSPGRLPCVLHVLR